MPLVLCNVVRRLWELFSGENEQLDDDHPCLIPKAICEAIGREIRAGRPTVPLSQARTLRDIYKHSGSYKAVDWMYFLLCTGEVVLTDRIPEKFSKIFMEFCHVGRLHFKPGALTEDELNKADKHLKKFCHGHYTHVFAGKAERLRLYQPTIVALLYVTANLRACGPTWSYCQFPAERLIGSITRLIYSRRFPYAALINTASAKFYAELVKSVGEGHATEKWAEATGKPLSCKAKDPIGTFSLSNLPKLDLLPPQHNLADLVGAELSRMNAVLAMKGAASLPDEIVAKKYFRLRLANGQIAGTVAAAQRDGDRRRDYLVRASSFVRRAAGRGRGVVRVPVNVYGAVHHYAVVLVDGKPQAYAFLQCMKSAADRSGAFGLAQKRRDMECFSSLGGAFRYVDVMSIDAVVGTLFVNGRHVVLHTREVFSTK